MNELNTNNMKILPCPFCGCTTNPVKENRRHYPGRKQNKWESDFYLKCDDCGLSKGNDQTPDQWGDIYCDFSTKEAALLFWNKRIKHQ